MHMPISIKLFVCSCIGLITADTPRIQNILKIFDPTIFPMAISFCPLRAATIEVTSSGSDVPTATIVRPITRSGIPKSVAIVIDPSTNIFPHTKSPPSPRRIKPIDFAGV